jgi:hypothetical protein
MGTRQPGSSAGIAFRVEMPCTDSNQAERVVRITASQPAPNLWDSLVRGLCCKDDRRRWEDRDKLDPISFMRRYRKER